MALSDKYDASFDGITFFELFSSSFSGDETHEADGNLVHYPGSDDNDAKHGGTLATMFEVSFAIETADWGALQTKKGVTAELVARGGFHYGSCYCKSVRAAKMAGHDVYKGSMTFWKIG